MPEAKPTPPQSAPEVIERAPEPTDKGGKVVRVMSPTHQFVVEGLPVVTREGTRVTVEQFKKIEEAANKQVPKVRIAEVND
jgi:ribosomal protein L24